MADKYVVQIKTFPKTRLKALMRRAGVWTQGEMIERALRAYEALSDPSADVITRDRATGAETRVVLL